MDERFIEFKGAPSRSGRARPKVTLNHRGVFHMNRTAARKLREADAVTLHFDIHKQIIGIRPADTKMPNAFPLKIKDENLSRVINASSFCKHFDIKVTRTVEFNNAVTDTDGMLRLNLADTTTIGREKRDPSG